ncbi:MAG: imidazole glycerol phosphate synthase subunit HisH [Rhodospirillales bacterium]|nr:imidazole glycerol phosphate synthase subunit HisH [Rhodospirillales bacterium]
MSAVVIIDYGSGNLRSAAKAFERALAERGDKRRVRVTAQAKDLAQAGHIVLPGVGAFADCKRGLDGLPGMGEALARAVLEEKRPFLGICVGMQLLADRGLEHGSHAGLGWIKGEVRPLTPSDPTLKIPHMGWNELEIPATPHPILEGLGKWRHAYFVHSYHFVAEKDSQVLARVGYGGPVAAVIGRDNIVGTQFHPEKSQAAGLALIANFLAWSP